MKEYLQPTEFLNFDDANVREFAERNSAGAKTEREKAVKLILRRARRISV